MALLTEPSDENIKFANRDIRIRTKQSVSYLEETLLDIAAYAKIHTKAAIAAELGADAAAFTSFYDNGRSLVLSVKPESTIPTRASLP